jgi:hypothetical protein
MSDTAGRCISLLDIARTALQAEAVRRAAEAVVKEWEDGNITNKAGSGWGMVAIACLRDALDGHIPEDVERDAKQEDSP